MSCQDAKRAIHLLVDGELPGNEVEVLRRHLDVCEVCQREHALARREVEVLEETLDGWIEEIPSRGADDLRLRLRKGMLLKVLALAAAIVLVFVLVTRRDHPAGGMLMVKRMGDRVWKEARENVVLGPGDSLVTGLGWAATFHLTPETRLAMRGNTEVRFDLENLLGLELVRGEVWVRSGEGERVVVSMGELSVEGAGAEFVVSGGGGDEEPRLGLVTPAWAAESTGGEVFVLEGEVVVRTSEMEEILGRGKRLAWRGRELVTVDLSREEERRLKWVEAVRDPYSGRAVESYGYVVLNPFSVKPRQNTEEGTAK